MYRPIRSFNPSGLIQSHRSQPKLAVVAIRHRFADFPVLATIKNNLRLKGYLAPTPIQDQVIPLILNGKDVVGVANTGTGKTAAFLVPLIDKAAKNRRTKVLIITPTRELAAQIEAEFIALAKNLELNSALCIGGAGMPRQIQRLRLTPEVVIGTPGRLKDLLGRRVLRLNEFTSVVLDEVDRMLDMGFIGDVKHLVSFLPKIRQSLFFSATIEGKVREVMAGFLNQPVIISVKTGEAAQQINQQVIRLAGRNKIDVLHDLLIKPGYDRVLVFSRTKWSLDKLARTLVERGFRVAAIHGNKSQPQRQRALDQFKRGQVKILLATDVAQRGLDIDSVSHVINYDLPQTREDYIHGGRIIYLLDPGIIQNLKFPTFWFENTTQGRFMISLAFSQAKYYVDSLSENTLRGLQQKAKRGEFPGRATIGYKNDLITHKIVIDPQKAPLIKLAINRFSQGDVSIKSLARFMTIKGLTLRNGNPMSGSEMHRIITDPFYYGAFMWKKELYLGTHQPLISKKIFDRNQQILNKSLYGKCARNYLKFPFKGLIKCAECGHPVTAENHTKKYKRSGTSQTFVYYRCTKANRFIKCSQKYLNEKDLIEQANNYISGFIWARSQINQALKLIAEQKQQELKNQVSGWHQAKSQISEVDHQINQLLDLRLKGVISDEEYLAKKNELTAKKLSLNTKSSQNGTNPNSSFEPVEIMFKNLAVASKIRGDDQNLAQKAAWLKMTASNLFLEDKKLKITREKHWAALCAAATGRNLG